MTDIDQRPAPRWTGPPRCRNAARRFLVAHGASPRRIYFLRWYPKPDGTWRISTIRPRIITRGRWRARRRWTP